MLRKLAEKKLKRKIVGKSSLKAFIASTERKKNLFFFLIYSIIYQYNYSDITDDPEKPAVLPVQGLE